MAGHNHPKTSEPTHSSSEDQSCRFVLSDGMFVAVYLEKYRDELPLIARIVSVRSSNVDVEVEWYIGCYSGDWKVCMRGRGRSREAWREQIPKSSILFPVELTKSMKLSKDTVEALKSSYKDILADLP